MPPIKANDTFIEIRFMNANTLKIENNNELYEFSFDDVCFYSSYTGRLSSSETPYLIENLSPKFGYSEAFNMEKMKMLRVLFILAISSCVIFFSDYNDKVPLLAPVLLLMALVPFIANIRNFTPTSWVRVYDDTGAYETSIPIPNNETDEESEKRKNFLSVLSKKIQDSYENE